MAATATSVEEFLAACPMDDHMAQLIVSNETLPFPHENASIDESCGVSEVSSTIDPADLNVDKKEFDQYFYKPSTAHDEEMLPVDTVRMPTCLVNLDGAEENIDVQLAGSFDPSWNPDTFFLNRALPIIHLDTLSNSFPPARTQTTAVTTAANHVPLSGSVRVKKPRYPAHAIEVVHELEESHKPRYKSDYFPQNGNVRSPRYVADRRGKNIVTLKVTPGVKGFIRVDWTTIEQATRRRYSMPYKFQQDNRSDAVPDINPICLPIVADNEGIMKAQLVLIKLKQDELKPLQLFPPVEQPLDTVHNRNVVPDPPMPPKKMIKYYQLTKSQLAFTFCPLEPDGQPGIPEWDTTVFSTILTEQEQPPKKRPITCPHCQHQFEIIPQGIDDIGHEKVVKRRKK